jgi:hypothetical protein
MKARKAKAYSCINCSRSFDSNSNAAPIYCSVSCRRFYTRSKKYSAGVLNHDYIICAWDNQPVGKYMSDHIKKFHIDKTIEQYQAQFPGQPIIAPAYLEKISKNSGKHMQTDYYKSMFSNKIKGADNPNHKSKTTLQQRQLCSKYSKEYWRQNFPELTEAEIELSVSQFAKSSQVNRLTETQLEYWLKKCGGDAKLAKIMLKDRQTTFSLDKCIKKYGEVEGKKKWIDRQEKWKKKVFNEHTYIGGGRSIVSVDFFNKIINELKLPADSYMFDKNEKFMTDTINNLTYKYDFTYLPNKRIIEFNGDYWHCNPVIYESDYYHKIKDMTAQQIWDYDGIKTKLAESHGYTVMSIYERNWIDNPGETLKKCIDFLNA